MSFYEFPSLELLNIWTYLDRSAVTLMTETLTWFVLPVSCRWAERFDHRLQQSVQPSVRRVVLSGQQLLCHRRKETRQVLVPGRLKRTTGTILTSNQPITAHSSLVCSANHSSCCSTNWYPSSFSFTGEQHRASDWSVRVARWPQRQYLQRGGMWAWPHGVQHLLHHKLRSAVSLQQQPRAGGLGQPQGGWGTRRTWTMWWKTRYVHRNKSKCCCCCCCWQTSSASCLAVSEDFIFCGCADGLIRVFSPSNLQYISSLHRPHQLGVDLTQSVQHG